MNDPETLSAILARRGDDALVVPTATCGSGRHRQRRRAWRRGPPDQLQGLSLIAAFGSAPLDEAGAGR